MPYFLNTAEDEREMLRSIGARSIEDLFEQVPAELRLNRPLDLPPAMTELELTAHLGALAAKNASVDQMTCFLGAGAYDHFVPAAVDALASRGEYYTSYTPYQAEASQGNLQVFFEYQTLITQLTGMDVSNASLYEGASAAAEAVLMCLNATRRHKRVVVLGSVHPHYRQTMATYLHNLQVELVTVPCAQGHADLELVQSAINSDTACLVVQQPNFFGALEDMSELAAMAHRAGAMFVASVDPLSLGLLQRPGEYGADIVVAEGQSLGTPLLFGGPYLGIMACREEFVRRMPGRLTGQTVDRRGKRCFVLTLQTREQHIRREKATSNICTNQGLFALRATIYLALLGPHGLREVADLCLQKAHYAAGQFTTGGRFSLAFESPYFKEFVLRDRQNDIPAVLEQTRRAGFLAGVPLKPWYPELSDCLVLAVTEKRTRAEIDRLAATLNAMS